MAKLFLHVGMPKTGSSYIQGLLNTNKALIETNAGIGILENNAPHQLACHLILDEKLRERSDIKELRSGSLMDISKKVEKYSKIFEAVIISSEYFILCDKKKLLAYFSHYYSEIEIIISVRRQDRLLASGYNQDVKALNRTSNLVWSFEDSPTFNYFDTCEQWSELGLRVAVIDYDRVRKEKNGLLDSFLSIIDITDDNLINHLDSPSIVATNYSFSQEELFIKLAMNRKGVSGDKVLEDFRKTKFSRTEFLLPIAYENIMASCYCESNRKFIEKYLENIDGSELDFSSYEESKQKEFNWDPISKINSILMFFIEEYDHVL